VAASIVGNIHDAYDGFLHTGIFGLARVFRVLSEHGHEDEAYRLLTKKGRNSFAFMWEQYNATTLWEVLPCDDNYEGSIYLRSHSHPMQAGFDQWFYAGIAGINPVASQPGFQLIEFRPYLTRYLDSASATYESGFGTIASRWENMDGRLTWHIRIPENSRGIIHAPTYGSGARITLNGQEVDVISKAGGFSLIGEFGPGEYVVEI
jgi:alpha-L-rhamnosidase